jgi:hypothetical protein
MSASITEFGGWTRRRFWGVAGLFFLLQAGLLVLFGGGGRAASKTVSPEAQIRLLGDPVTADQLSKLFFASDPAVFVRPSPHDFSGRAWLNAPEEEAQMPQETEEPAWLRLDSARLGTNFPSLARNASLLPFGLMDGMEAAPEPWPVFLPPETFRTQSVLVMQGDLARRELNPPKELRVWPNAQVLSNTVVQIAVNSAGQVISARLLGRSGSTDADTNALDEAGNLRFRPSVARAPVWGQAIFEWQTVEPTNPGPSAAR